ncbi:MAG: hypothetical protein M3Z96_12305 [Pseudomonadota bacterium]|nr:hypothetical protein [Pseudomonadota bacterium]
MAIAIDLGYVTLEFALLACASVARRNIAAFAHPTVAAALMLSAVLNAMAFAEHAEATYVKPAVVIGAAVKFAPLRKIDRATAA